jgi:glucan endo-1,3-beta-D-glucosidase
VGLLGGNITESVQDLYRASPTGIKNKSGAGASADEIVKYIQQTRDALNGHPDLQQKILHVDVSDRRTRPPQTAPELT